MDVKWIGAVCQVDVDAVVAHASEAVRSRLRRLREAAELTQSQVAEALSVSRQTVAAWEAANDPGDRWLELAALYGVRESYPDAPFNPERRLAWFRVRNAMLADYGPHSVPPIRGKQDPAQVPA